MSSSPKILTSRPAAAIQNKPEVLKWLKQLVPQLPVDEKKNDNIVLFGSRGIQLLAPGIQEEVDQVPVPLPVRDLPQEEKEGKDWDLIMYPRRLEKLLRELAGDDIHSCYLVEATKHVMLALKNPNGFPHLLNIELVLSRGAYKLTTELDQPTSAHLIMNESLASQPVNPVFLPAPLQDIQAVVAPLDVQYAIKRSHNHFPIKWRAGIEATHLLRSYLNMPWILVGTLGEIVRLRREEAVSFRGEEPGAHISLEMSNEDFFSDEVSAMLRPRQWNHDKLHELIAYHQGVPLYTRFKKDQSKANLSKEMFDEALMQDKLRLVREESMALALERYLLPKRCELTPEGAQEAYWLALERVCTTLSKGWFREFANMHYPEVKILDKDLLGPADLVLNKEPEAYAYTKRQRSPSPEIPSKVAKIEHVVEPEEISDDSSEEEVVPVQVIPPMPTIINDSSLLRQDWVDSINKVLQNTTVEKHRTTTNTVNQVLLLKSTNSGEGVKLTMTEKYTSAGWEEGKRKKATWEIHVTLGSVVLLDMNLNREFETIHHEGFWHDSGCEWDDGRYIRGWSQKVNRDNVDLKEGKLPNNDDLNLLFPNSDLPLTLKISVIMSKLEPFCMKNSLIKRLLQVNHTFWPSIYPQTNLVTLWCHQVPYTIFGDAIKLNSQTKLDLSWVKYDKEVTKRLFSTLQNHAAHLKLEEITIAATNDVVLTGRISDALKKMPRLKQVTIMTTSFRVQQTAQVGCFKNGLFETTLLTGHAAEPFVTGVENAVGREKVRTSR